MHRIHMTLVTVAVGILLSSTLAFADGPAIFPLSQVKTGQKGYGLTVFTGTKPERFSFEVVNVVRNFLPKQDIILVKSDDPKINEVGFARGMSGSPLFIDGKVACAFSYGFSFTRGNIGGCTPIEYMLADGARPTLLGPTKIGLASRSEWRRHRPLASFLSARTNRTRATGTADEWLLGAPLPTVPPQSKLPSGSGFLEPAALPLAAAGLGPTAFEQARKIFAPYGIELSQGSGGTGSGKHKPTPYVMGGAIGAQLARGDVSLVATGTVSYVDKNKVLAFGHPFFQFGEVYMPAVAAEIHAVVPSLAMAFKMASPLGELGSMVQDRQSCIVVDTQTKTELIPVRISVKGPGGQDRFDNEVLRHRLLTPPLVGMMVANAAKLYAPEITDSTVTIKSKLFVRGFKPLTFTDYAYSDAGPGKAIAEARALRVLTPILLNPFEPATVERVEVDVAITYQADYLEIDDVRLPSPSLPPGKTSYIEVSLHRFGGGFTTERIPLAVPMRLAGSTVKLQISAGDTADYEVAPPRSLNDLVEILRMTYPANALVATIFTADSGVKLGGRVIPNLPDSAVDTANLAATGKKQIVFKSAVRTVIPQKQVVVGTSELVVAIDDH